MGKRKERDSIIFINDHMKLAERLLDDSERGRLYTALRRYSMEGIYSAIMQESGSWLAIFEMMRSAQDKAIRNYEDTCERNRLHALKRYASAADACDGSRGSQSCQSNLIQSKIIESNENPVLNGQEDTGVTGVTGVVWL